MNKIGKMMVVYVAGAYRAKWKIRQILNILKARKQSIKLWRAGIAAICPHTNTAFVDSIDNYILPGDIEIMKRCDAVLILDNWRSSVGTQAEMKAAISKDIPIYFNIDNLIKAIKQNDLINPSRIIENYRAFIEDPIHIDELKEIIDASL